jgi:glutamyl-tRNA synthetase
LEGIDDFSLENQEKIVHEWVEQKEYKLGNVMNAWRLTLVGEGKGPGCYFVKVKKWRKYNGYSKLFV